MNNKISAVIVDDEPLSIDVIEAYLKAFPAITLSGRFTRSKPAVEKIIALQPDLLFLDVQMPVMNGFQLLEAIGDRHNPYIIFTTAFDQYAIRAFDVNAIGYLLKPFDQEKFNHAVHKFMAQYTGKTDTHMYEGLLKILQEQQQPPAYLERIMIKEVQRIFYIPVSEIIYFEASGDYVKVVTARQSHLIHESMQSLEQQLSPRQFIRIHRSFMINTNEVQEFIPYFNGEYTIVMRNKASLKMSRNYKDNLKRIFREL